MDNTLCKRNKYLKRIRPFYNETEIIKVLTGPRRCGKSSLMKIISRELYMGGVDMNNLIFIDLDSLKYRNIKDSNRLEKEILNQSEGTLGIKYLFIDEIQKVKPFEEMIEGLRNSGEYSIFITGSNSYLLSGELMTCLTGRYIEFPIYPLTFDEYIEFKKFFKIDISSFDKELEKYILNGGFPFSVKLNDTDSINTYSKEIIQEIINKDIRKNKKIKDKELLDSVMTYIINNFGSTTNIEKLCEYLSRTLNRKIYRAVVYNYLEILENAKIISKCSRFDLKSKKALKREEKYYLSDLNFYFSRNTDRRINYGPCLENVVYNYLLSEGYAVSIGKVGSLEVDFICRDMYNNYSYIQVCKSISKEDVEDREYRSLEKIKDNYPKYVLTLDTLLQRRNGIIHRNIVSYMLKEDNPRI